ncbi:hypothetical protein RchiOBHm_Chr2g0129701 [Rosa chinensis]|uniref:Uncharacterized protein n=1 Tax=Rosa chinensis TaxID=74649 RepID=A0A2P6RUN4_ROSCH|nr:hypothetical protein RchiOBHm_Chr2g0129701 [Rosa chinensis]
MKTKENGEEMVRQGDEMDEGIGVLEMVTKENGEEMVRQGDEMDEGIGVLRVRGEVYL